MALYIGTIALWNGLSTWRTLDEAEEVLSCLSEFPHFAAAP
jgi:hypothetical protein